MFALPCEHLPSEMGCGAQLIQYNHPSIFCLWHEVPPTALTTCQGQKTPELSGFADWQGAVTQEGKGPSKALSVSFKFTGLHIKHFYTEIRGVTSSIS